MKSLFTTLYAAALLLTSTATAMPAKPAKTTSSAAPLCTRATQVYRNYGFDDLGDSQGKPAPINSTGYGDYKGMVFYEGQQRFVTEGDNVSTVPVLAQDGPLVNVTSHSHKNAIMGNYWNYQWNAGNSFQVGSYPNPFNYFDIKSFWVRSQTRGAFQFSFSCAVTDSYSRGSQGYINATWNVPALPDGSFYKITPTPKQNLTHVWRCYYGIHANERVLLDDIALCLGNTANKGDHP